MSDIVERLRKSADLYDMQGLRADFEHGCLLTEAADEIERLRKYCKTSDELLERWQEIGRKYEDRVTKLQAIVDAAKKYIEMESHTATEYAAKYAARLRLIEALADLTEQNNE